MQQQIGKNLKWIKIPVHINTTYKLHKSHLSHIRVQTNLMNTKHSIQLFVNIWCKYKFQFQYKIIKPVKCFWRRFTFLGFSVLLPPNTGYVSQEAVEVVGVASVKNLRTADVFVERAIRRYRHRICASLVRNRSSSFILLVFAWFLSSEFWK